MSTAVPPIIKPSPIEDAMNGCALRSWAIASPARLDKLADEMTDYQGGGDN